MNTFTYDKFPNRVKVIENEARFVGKIDRDMDDYF